MPLVVRTPQPLNILPRGVEVNIDDEENDSQQSRRLVCVGDRIVSNASGGISRGHGTTLCQGHVVATVCGAVERVNKLVIVRPLKSKYNPEVGDVVVGRVVEVVGKRWKVDINAKHSGTLLLSAVNLPGGVQRRRTAEDELNMRSVLVESDLVCTEIQQLFQLDGSIMLHTRSPKYGKLKGGQVVRVPANLVRRQKTHFVHLEELGMDIILGCNGFVWVGVHQANRQPVDPEASRTAAKAGEMSEVLRENLVRMANAVRALDRLYRPITMAGTLEAFQLSIKHCMAAKLMLEPSFLQLLADRTAQDMDTGR